MADNMFPTSEKTTGRIVNIGTRKSQLALAQTEIIHKMLLEAHPGLDIRIHAMSTMGDKNLVTALHSFGAKNLWTHELEAGLVQGELDVIVHSLKDMPTQLPDTCMLACVPEREDPRDVVVMKAGSQYKKISELPEGSVIGTSSVRRSAQIARAYPGLKFANVRGNLGTRLGKLDAEDGEYACIILAAAGLKRIGLEDRITEYLEAPTVLHAVGQGGLGIEVRVDDKATQELLQPLIHKPTYYATLAERSLLRTLEGGCSVPIGAETKWEGDDVLALDGAVVSLDGKEGVFASMKQSVKNQKEAEALGAAVAKKLLEEGAGKILDAIKNTKVPIKE